MRKLLICLDIWLNDIGNPYVMAQDIIYDAARPTSMWTIEHYRTHQWFINHTFLHSWGVTP